MKRLLIMLCGIYPAVLHAQTDDFTINGTLSTTAPVRIFLSYAQNNQVVPDAIAKDQLQEWTHVSDLQSRDNAVPGLYGVSSVPRNLLIDPQGKIIAVDLRGEGLERINR